MNNIGTAPRKSSACPDYVQAITRTPRLLPELTQADIGQEAALVHRPKATSEDLLGAWLERRSDHTRRAYETDLESVAEWLQVPGPAHALTWLIAAGQGEANLAVHEYCGAQRRAGKSPATINRRLAAIASVLKLARSLGMTSITIDVPRERNQQYRDTRGPSLKTVRSIIAKIGRRLPDPKAVRDLAIIRLLFNNGLRCHEVCGLDLGHYNRAGQRLSILGKGRTRREWISLSPKASAAVRSWLKIRGTERGPLFVSMIRNRTMAAGKIRPGLRRIAREDIFRMCKPYGVRPHGFRHAAITAALEKTNGNIVAAQRFSRHASPVVLMTYEDNRQDKGGKVARLLDDVA